MQGFETSEYFDLNAFNHQVLFVDNQPVWNALKEIKAYLREQSFNAKPGKIHPRAELINEETISIGKGTVIEAGVTIKGPCIIGENCEVRQGAYLRGYVIVGNHCVIGHTTEVKNSIFLSKAQAGHFAYIGDSILGNGVNLGAGAKLANLRLDGRSVLVRSGEELYDSGLRKFGAILGDGVQIGCNVVTNPGTLFGKNSLCHPCLNPRGVIPKHHGVVGEKLPSVVPLSHQVSS